MYNVVITYTNGEKTQFVAQGFDVDFDTDSDSTARRIQKLQYKDANGNDAFVYLTPTQVAGIVLIPR